MLKLFMLFEIVSTNKKFEKLRIEIFDDYLLTLVIIENRRLKKIRCGVHNKITATLL